MIFPRTKVALLALTLAGAAAACDGGGQAQSGTPSAQEKAARSALAPSTTEPSRPPKTAAQIAMGMGVPGARVVDVTVENDRNQLLGRPHGYISLAALVDPTITAGQDCHGVDPGVDCGAKIEVFGAPADAEARKTYIQGLRTGGALGTEYNTVVGNALLRIDGKMSPDKAKSLEASFVRAAG